MRYHRLGFTVWTCFFAAWLSTMCSNNALAQCEVQLITSPKGEKGNLFGAVSVDEDIAVIGDSLAFNRLGAAFVYRSDSKNKSDWQLEAILMSPEPDTEENFVRGAIDGGVIVVGAPGASSPEFHRGRAYVYRYDESGQWKHEATLTASDGDFGDEFGFSVSINANVILIGARNDENDGVPLSGSAYIFRYDPQTKQWLEEAKLTNPNGKQLDLFGFAVSLYGNVAFVTAGTDEPGIDAGSVFVFRRKLDIISGLGEWYLEAQLIASDAHSSDFFGWSISTGKDIAVIGARWDDDNGTQSGSAYVFRYNSSLRRWIEEIKLLASDGEPFDSFGTAVSCDEKASSAIVGAPLANALGSESGAAYLFRKNTIGWEEANKLTASDGNGSDFFGATLTLSKSVSMISAHRPSEEPGSVYVFDLEPPTADFNCDGVVNLADLIYLLGMWGPCADCTDCDADLDNNCTVSTGDLLILFANWG